MNDNSQTDDVVDTLCDSEEYRWGESPDASSGEMPVEAIGRILVALDASPHSLNALRAAAELAAVTESELHGLYIEDLNLLRMCGLPFVPRDRLLFGGAPTTGQSNHRTGVSIAGGQDSTYARPDCRWRPKSGGRFRSHRGMVAAELLAAAESAGLVTLGRVGRSPGKRFGSTAQMMIRRTMRPLLLLGDGGLNYPLTLLYSGSAASNRALWLAVALMRSQKSTMRVLFASGLELKVAQRTPLADRLQQEVERQGLAIELEMLGSESELNALLRDLKSGTLVIPGEYAALLDDYTQPVILVP